MTALDNNPVTNNLLSQLGFRLFIKKLPNVNYFCQKANLPGIQIKPVIQGTPFANIPHAGDRVEFNELNIEFIVDEDLNNYLELYNWIRKLGFPESYDEYASLLNEPVGEGIKSEGILSLLSNNKNLNKVVTFHDMFPISLSDIDFSVVDTDVEYRTAYASFVYIYYDIA